MNTLDRLVAHPRLIALLVLLVSLTALAAAFTAQYGFDLEPCALCIYQRIPYVVTAVLAIGALRMADDSPSHAWILGVMGLVFATGAVIAAYHVGVEQHWWEAVSSCGPSADSDAMSFGNLRAQLEAGEPPKPCDEVDWTFLGLSIATYNMVYSAGLALGCLGLGHLIRGERSSR